MEFVCELISLDPAPGRVSAALSDSLKVKIKVAFPSGERTLPLGTYLGNVLATSLATPTEATAASVFCWDEDGEFRDFLKGPPSIWLVDGISSALSGEWRSEGYGYTNYAGARVARWVLWEETEDAHAIYEALSVTYNMDNSQHKEVDAYLARHLVCKDGSNSNAAAFVSAVGCNQRQAKRLLKHTKSAIGKYLTKCRE